MEKETDFQILGCSTAKYPPINNIIEKEGLKLMEKKEYIKPEIKIVTLQDTTDLLQCSGNDCGDDDYNGESG